MATKKKLSSCPVMRRKLVTHAKWNLTTGKKTLVKKEWTIEPCGTPLFGNNQAIGECKGCHDGWHHKHNYRLKK